MFDSKRSREINNVRATGQMKKPEGEKSKMKTNQQKNKREDGQREAEWGWKVGRSDMVRHEKVSYYIMKNWDGGTVGMMTLHGKSHHIRANHCAGKVFK